MNNAGVSGVEVEGDVAVAKELVEEDIAGTAVSSQSKWKADRVIEGRRGML